MLKPRALKPLRKREVRLPRPWLELARGHVLVVVGQRARRGGVLDLDRHRLQGRLPVDHAPALRKALETRQETRHRGTKENCKNE